MLNRVMDVLAMEQLARIEGKKAIKFENGWIFSLEFRHFQKRNGQVYVYVTPQMFGRWIVQAYTTGTKAGCSLEARIQDPSKVEKLFTLGEKWLEKYENGLKNEELRKDPYAPNYEHGWKGKNITDEPLYY